MVWHLGPFEHIEHSSTTTALARLLVQGLVLAWVQLVRGLVLACVQLPLALGLVLATLALALVRALVPPCQRSSQDADTGCNPM